MKLSELSFADHAAVEITPALVKQFHFFGAEPHADAAREAYRLADALSAERERRADRRDHELETLRARAERAETSYSVLLNMDRDVSARIALTQIWEMLQVQNQTQAMETLRKLVHGGDL